MQYYFYCPLRSCEGYVFTGVCLPQCMLGYHTPRSRHPHGADTPWEQIPWSRHAHRSRHPQSRHPPEQTTPNRHLPQSRQPPQETATAADGTHPTGMHSCLLFIYLGFQNYYLIDHYCKRQNVFSDLVEIRSIS